MKRLFRENFVKKEKKETTSNKRRGNAYLDFDKLTPDNQAVKDLKDLIQLTVFQNEDMERFMTFMPNVTNGKKQVLSVKWKISE